MPCRFLRSLVLLAPLCASAAPVGKPTAAVPPVNAMNTDGHEYAPLRRLRLPVLLVVGMRLGCLNHALLTADAIAARGLVLAGWVANRIEPAMARGDDSVAALAERLPAPLVADVGFGRFPAFSRRDCERLGLAPRAQMSQRT